MEEHSLEPHVLRVALAVLYGEVNAHRTGLVGTLWCVGRAGRVPTLKLLGMLQGRCGVR